LCIGDTEYNNNPNAVRNIRVIINSHNNCNIEQIDPVETTTTTDCILIPANKNGFITESNESGHIYNSSVDSLAEGIKTELEIMGQTIHMDSPIANGIRSHAEGGLIEFVTLSNCSWPVNGNYSQFIYEVTADSYTKTLLNNIVGTILTWNNIKRIYKSVEFFTENE